MTSKCYKLEIKAHILVEDDDGNIQEIVTAPIFIYKGTEFDYESIQKLEELAIQRLSSSGRGESK